MKTKIDLWIGLFVLFMTSGCMLVPSHRGDSAVLVPLLPPVVVLGAEPYYDHGGYHYYYRNGSWAYSHSRRGPWVDLPRDHYPREVRFRDGGSGHYGERGHGHKGR